MTSGYATTFEKRPVEALVLGAESALELARERRARFFPSACSER